MRAIRKIMKCRGASKIAFTLMTDTIAMRLTKLDARVTHKGFDYVLKPTEYFENTKKGSKG